MVLYQQKQSTEYRPDRRLALRQKIVLLLAERRMSWPYRDKAVYRIYLDLVKNQQRWP